MKKRFDFNLCVAIEDLRCRKIFDFCDLKAVCIAKGSDIGEFILRICAKRNIIAFIESNRSYDFA
jgi:hypothetical protein